DLTAFGPLEIVEHVALDGVDPQASNTADEPNRVTPECVEVTEAIDGTVTVQIAPAAWHLIRLTTRA
ncbi:MAG: alpha-L-arabinofuranosidase, partial [Actinomycetota bacterium]|nr:alpha-L-arabinofuranosidase [Actinomycetota bacterium]